MMKRILTALFSVGVFIAPAHAYMEAFGQFDSSYTATNETTAIIPNTPPGTILIGVAVSTGSGTLSIYDSSGTAQRQVGLVRLTGTQGSFCIPYEVRLSSGLTYTSAGNTGGVTFIFKRMR